jgi:hypothetical protein
MLPSAFHSASALTKTVLSRLHHTAYGLAVYASQPRSPYGHARLATGRWPTVPGRDLDPLGPIQRFQTTFLSSSSSARLRLAHAKTTLAR